MRTLVLGDVHGNFRGLLQVLERSGFSSKDKLIGLGDYTDGYPQSAEVVDYLIKEVPNFLGLLGNHDCLHKDTEFLTECGWLKYPEISRDIKVGQFDKERNITFAFPLARIEGFSEKMIRIEGNQTCQVVTKGHSVILNGKKIRATELLDGESAEFEVSICGNVKNNDYPIDDNILRLIVWTVCDGTIVPYNGVRMGIVTKRIQFKLSKKRKIDKLVSILKEANINYTLREAIKEGANKLQPYYVCIYTKEARRVSGYFDDLQNKIFPAFFKKLSKRQIDIVIDSLVDTDVYIDRWGKGKMVSIKLENILFLQELFCLNDIESRVSEVNKRSGFKNGKQQYQIYFWPHRRAKRSYKLKVSEMKYNDVHYCFKMPMGTLITRFKGKIAFTGNCWTKDWLQYGTRENIWVLQGGQSTIESYVSTKLVTEESHRKFFRSLFDYLEMSTDHGLLYGFVHGGWVDRNGLGYDDTYTYTWDRKLWDHAAHRGDGKLYSEIRTKKYDRVFLGHTATNFDYPDCKPVKRSNIWNLDTGAGWGGKLTLMDADTEEYWQSDLASDLYPESRGRM